ncbi:histone deacetylase family protein (macronuclear) [Tetrahymena thermophila SB210]|uniref:Histone deacetylase family protein n=1 Tax=Tetrahymena thermophila (strain SB210) TaxID=312017 RepID=Q23M98_TETTS|nr:histone deacetylase family protein [Tetrahymena thermophila SB210]EAR97741.2 histone deacetylase family protein [Tetrahymena thermophila SB210]|eukprot:XP_001017986.2 histone deacetylase family protein [Tetrahymena thermophila SB210]
MQQLIFLLATIYQILRTTQAGTITPTTQPPPIYNTLANAGVRADYTFSFIPQTFLPAGGNLQIIFPSQYSATQAFQINNLVCSVTCQASGLTLTFTFPYDLAAGIAQTVTVQQVLNPSTKGGVGSFILQTLQGQNIVDQNKIFGIIGIADISTNLISANIQVNPSGSDLAGDYTSYQLTFQTASNIPAGSYFILQIPTDFTLEDYPTCISPSLNGYFIAGQLICTLQSNNQVRIDGVVGVLTQGINYVLQISMQNPPYTINPNTASSNYVFSFQIYKQGTQILFESISGIQGPAINAAGLNNISLTPTDQLNLNNRYIYAEYKLNFTPTLALENGNCIVISFPAYFQVLVSQQLMYLQENMYQLHYINYGLDNLSENNKVQISVSSNSIIISNFATQQFIQEISVIIMTRNPDAAGTATPLKIYIYQDTTQSTLIAQDVNSATANIDPYTSCDHSTDQILASINYYLWNNAWPKATQTPVVIPSIQFEFKPLKTIPIGGLIKIAIPKEFTFNPAFPTTATDCGIYYGYSQFTMTAGNTPQFNNIYPSQRQRSTLFQTYQPVGTAGSNSFACQTSITGNIMTISGIQNTLFGNQGLIHILVLKNWVMTPARNATYFFALTSYDSDKYTILESWKDAFQINPKDLTTTPVVNLINNYVSSVATISKSILDIQLTTDITIPSGQPIYKSTDTQGFIQLDFRQLSGGDAWQLGLGLNVPSGTQIPCRGIQGIIPIQGSSIICTYVQASYTALTTTTFSQIFIKNFVQIPANTLVRIHIPNLLNPQGGGTTSDLSIRLVSNTNNVYQYLAQKSILITDKPIGTFVVQNVLNLSYSTNYVGQTFNLGFNTKTSPSAGDLLLIQLPTFSNGFIVQDQTISCSVNSINMYCIPYYQADMILIMISQNFASPQQSILISNINWPQYQSNFVATFSTLDVYWTSSTGVTNKAERNNQLINNLPNQFSNASIVIPKKGIQYVDCSYQFSFTGNADIPALSLIQVIFPNNYNLLGSTPLPTVTYSGLTSYSSSQQLSIQITIQMITISNNQYLPAGSTFTVTVSGVKNPSTMPANGLSTGWGIQVVQYDAVNDISNLVMQQLNFYSFAFDPVFTPGTIVFNSITAFPLNADETATYTIQFTPYTNIPIQGVIQITFPQNNFKSLPSPPNCSMGGAVTTFSSCTLSGSTFSIVIQDQYNSGSGSITLSITNIKNPDQGTSDGFIIETTYDGQTLDITDQTTLSSRTITTVQRAPEITVNSITFSPQNISERSTYTFSFITSDIITSQMQILFQFPSDYDKLLGKNVKCIIVSGILGNFYSCYVQNGGVYLQNFDSYQPSSSNPIVVQIFGVTNPNIAYTNTGQFSISLLYKGDNKFINSQSQAGQLQMYGNPGWLSVQTVTASQFNVRYTASYQFSFTLSKNVPKILSQGAIFIDFPPQFDQVSDGRGSCTTTTASFAQVIDCYTIQNRYNVTGNTQDFSGQLQVSIASVLNPTFQGITDNFYVSSFDGINQIIIDRSYINLDPFSFSYVYPGPLIHVNNDQGISLYPGTQTVDLYITLDFPSLLELSVKPNILPGFKVIPFDIPIHLGQTSIPFRISCPQQIFSGSYTLQWVTLGDNVPPIYTPIQTSQITILNPTIQTVLMNSILDIPYGGTSLDTILSVTYASDIYFEVHMNLASQYPGISLSTQMLNFTKGINQLSFRVISTPTNNTSSSVSRGSIVFSLLGIDSTIFQLQYTQMYFNLIAADNIAPQIIQLQTVNILKNSVQINVMTNEPTVVYYMCSLNGTSYPSFSQVFNKTAPPANTTQSQYGQLVLNQANANFYFNITNLTAQTPYIIHLFFQDRGNNVANKTLTFVTSNRYNAATFSLRFQVLQLSATEIKSVLINLSNILTIDLNTLYIQKYYFNNTSSSTSSSRILQSTQLADQINQIQETTDNQGNQKRQKANRILDVSTSIYTLLNIQISSNRLVEYYPSPLTLANSLNNKTVLLKAAMPTYDSSYLVIPNTFVSYYPNFIQPPQFLSNDWSTANFTVVLDQPGFVYVTGELYVSNTQPSPYPDQIYWGYDHTNIKAPSGYVEVSQGYTQFNLTLRNLKPNSKYFAYIIGGSVQPGYPDLMDASKIVRIQFTTLPSPSDLELDINTGTKLEFSTKFLVLLFLIIQVFI